jgi:hypothetical protein
MSAQLFQLREAGLASQHNAKGNKQTARCASVRSPGFDMPQLSPELYEYLGSRRDTNIWIIRPNYTKFFRAVKK